MPYQPTAILAANFDSGTLVGLLLIAVILALTAMLILPRRIARRSLLAKPRATHRENQHQLEETLEALMVQLHDVSRDVHAKVDTKMASLNHLVEEADRKITDLRMTLGRMTTARGIDLETGAASAKPSPTDGESARKQQEVYRLADAGEDLLGIARTTGIHQGEVELILLLRQT